MRSYTRQDAGEKSGGCWNIYSPPGYGKTVSSALTLPEPVAIVNNEPRNPFLAIGPTTRDIKVFEPESFEEEIELYNGWVDKAKAGEFRYKSILKDGLTFTMGTYKSNLADDRAGIRLDKMNDKERSEATSRNYLRDKLTVEQADWGLLSEMMIRITKLLNSLSKYDIVVVTTAIAMDNPKWDRALASAPALLGKEYPSQMNAFFDFIGLLTEPWKLLEDGTIRPPVVSFVSEKGDYMAKCCNAKLARMKEGPLDFGKILSIIRG